MLLHQHKRVFTMSIEVREDIAHVSVAQQMGFNVKSPRNNNRSVHVDYDPKASIPHNPLSYEIGNVVVWAARGGWRFAQLIDGYYRNHSEVIRNLQACLWAAKGRYDRVQAI